MQGCTLLIAPLLSDLPARNRSGVILHAFAGMGPFGREVKWVGRQTLTANSSCGRTKPRWTKRRESRFRLGRLLQCTEQLTRLFITTLGRLVLPFGTPAERSAARSAQKAGLPAGAQRITKEQVAFLIRRGYSLEMIAFGFGISRRTLMRRLAGWKIQAKDLRTQGWTMRVSPPSLREFWYSGREGAPTAIKEVPPPSRRKRLMAELRGMSAAQVASHFGITPIQAKELMEDLRTLDPS